MAEGRGFAPLQLYGLALAFQASTLLASVNPPLNRLERGERIAISTQPWEGRMFLLHHTRSPIQWLPRWDFHPQPFANRASTLSFELRGNQKWYSRRILRPIRPT